MADILTLHPENPQLRLVKQVAAVLRDGGVIVYPTDSIYALGCLAGNKSAIERIIRIRRLDPRHNMTLVCRDLAEIGSYAKLDNTAYRFIRRLTPGPYTFLVKATRDVPRRLQHPQRRTIGLRVPDHPVVHAILGELGEPVLSTSLILPGAEYPETEPDAIYQRLRHEVDLVAGSGAGGLEPTTVLDLTDSLPRLVRQGLGEVDGLL